MELVANIFLAAGAIGAGLYCLVLARRLKRFNDLERGVGGAVAVLSSQVNDLQKSLVEAKQAAENSWESIEDLTKRAEAAAQRLEIMMASMHDIADVSDASPTPTPPKEPVEDNGPIFVRHSRSGEDVHH
ncbi:hypothetical protein [Jhaorihella thermophila]|uniref:Uncharacterized protein n=1 Tax=Jhaorihella thermophila TaxID=488547 RepID=A0A1H5XGZ2_9RHOB|nr:hypothetical protein [Jhaorihella thermophila]SEG10627.1 hypothetical protein SAMN05421751_1116 [Jhaorihella thermophila]